MDRGGEAKAGRVTDATPPRWRADDTIRWLIEEGRFAPDFDALVGGVAARLLSDGLPVWRFRVGFRTLHPLVTAVTGIWERDEGKTTHFEAEHGLEGRTGYIGSPMEQIALRPEPFRKRLEDGLDESDHSVLHELRARGATDYFGRRLSFAGDGAGMILLTTDEPGGFTEAEIAGFDMLAAAISPMVEIERLRRISNAVAEAYLGPRTGRRVLGGRITRGDVETINAAIMISDMRNWTGISASLPPEEAIALANRYFDIVSAAVEAEGGEVLKFMGDGVLAIFPDDEDSPSAALAAARAALAEGMAEGVAFGFGLHVGEVLYGNIGSETRLDFTVLGQAVNIAARIEGLCSLIGEPLLYSEAFAERLARPGRRVGDKDLKGVPAPVGVYADGD